MADKCNCSICEKELEMLKKAMEVHAYKLKRLDSSILRADHHWGKSSFKPLVNSLYYALEAYKCDGDVIKKLIQRVKCFRRRMFFMSDEAVEKEAHALASELEAFLEF